MGGLPPRSDASRGVIAPILGDDALFHAGRAPPRGEASSGVQHAAERVPFGVAGPPPSFLSWRRARKINVVPLVLFSACACRVRLGGDHS
eukprot:2967789-Pyramimonas_sp.AAC.1